MKLSKDFYLRPDVVQIAQELLGKTLITKFDNKLTAAIITETEAYAGEIDKASHAYGGRRTKRTEIMYGEGGTAYVYLCYGIHSLFNVVTNQQDIPHAVLIRAAKPVEGVRTILKRRNMPAISKNISAGPGTVSQALGIHYSHTGLSLLQNKIWIEDSGIRINEKEMMAGPRVGVDYAGDHAKWPFRFRLIENKK